MTDWRTLYERHDWDAINNWWRHCDDDGEVRAFYEALCRDVPRVKRRNGMELEMVHVRAKEAPEEWKAAARILERGELEHRVVGGLPRPTDQLKQERQRIESLLSDLRAKPEPTEGNPEFSRNRHIEVVFDQFTEFDKIEAVALASIDPDVTRPDDRSWLKDVLAEAFLSGLEAGQHTWAAVGKDFEAHAVRGEIVKKGASEGGQSRKRGLDPLIKQRLDCMQQFIDRGRPVREAAGHASKKFGGTVGANEKLWHRHRSGYAPQLSDRQPLQEK